MGVESHTDPNQCRHDSLLFGPRSLSPALLAAEVASAQAVSVPPQSTAVRKFAASWGVNGGLGL